MKNVALLLLLLLLTTLTFAQTSPVYGSPYNDGIGIRSHPITTISSTDGLMALWGNPAAIGVYDGVGLMYMRATNNKDYVKDGGFGARISGLAYSAEYINEVPSGMSKAAIYNWGLGWEMGDGFYFGTRYQYSTGIDQQNAWSIGMLARPYSWLSFGAVARNVNEPRIGSEKTKSIFDLGLSFRPLAISSWKHGHRVTVGADVSLYERDSTTTTKKIKYGDKLDPRYFIEVEPIDGIKLQAQYAAEPKETRVGIGFATNHSQVAHNVRNADSKMQGGLTTYLFESDGLLSLKFPEQPKIVTMKMPSALDEQMAPFSFFASRNPELEKFLKKIRRLTNDKDVKAVILYVDGISIGAAKMQAIMREFDKFKQAGKKLYVYSKSLSNGSYMLASMADKIYVHPEGDVYLVGYASGSLYVRGTLDKLGVEMEVEASGPHKTAPNMFTEKHMTDQDRAQREWLVGDLYRQFTERIARYRGWSVDTVKAKIDNGPYNAKEALAAKLIDGTMYPDEVDKKFKEMFTGKKESDQKKLFNFSTGHDLRLISAGFYFMDSEVDPRWDRPLEPKVAVIYAVGTITSGNSGSSLLSGRSMGSETMVRAIREARNDKQVKAIVLRVDSPGGSGFASDEMWRELMLCRDDTNNIKPVVVSFSDVAASGGYYIATPGSTIVSEEGSITGSIGVFSMRPVLDSTLYKIGSNYEEIKFGKHAGMFNLFRKHTPEERSLVERQIKYFYREFVQKVADSRKMKWESVDSIGNGRVWTGMQGRKNGLVDTLGGLELAIEIAKAKAKIGSDQKPDILVYPEPMGIRLALELQNAMMTVLPEPMCEAIRTSYAVKNTKPGEIMLVAPDWVKETIDDEGIPQVKR